MLVPKFEFDHSIYIPKSSKQMTQKSKKSSQTHQNHNIFDKNINIGAENSKFDSSRRTESQHVQGNFQILSPNSRAQAIAQGQREMMEMVKNIPESCYELTLKDIVDHHRIEGEKIHEKQRKNMIKRSESSSSDHNGGLLLKMVFPVSIMRKKNKKSEKVTKSKISTKPPNLEKSSKNVGNEWWKMRNFWEDGFARINSTGSNNSRGRKIKGCLPGYFSANFLSKRKKTSAK